MSFGDVLGLALAGTSKSAQGLLPTRPTKTRLQHVVQLPARRNSHSRCGRGSHTSTRRQLIDACRHPTARKVPSGELEEAYVSAVKMSRGVPVAPRTRLPINIFGAAHDALIDPTAKCLSLVSVTC